MSKFQNLATPGPWFSTANHVQSLTAEKLANYVCNTKGADPIQKVANAQLIAAAPEMRDALIHIGGLLEVGDPQTIADYMQLHVAPLLNKAMVVKPAYEVRVEQLELEDFTTSDAQGVADVEERDDELVKNVCAWFEQYKDDTGLPNVAHDVRVSQLEFDGYPPLEAKTIAIQEEVDGVMHYNIDEWHIKHSTVIYTNPDAEKFHWNDSTIFAKLNLMGEAEVKQIVELVLSRGYTGTDLSIVVDVLNESFPEHELSVFDAKSSSMETAKSVGLLEKWSDKAYLMGLGGSHE